MRRYDWTPLWSSTIGFDHLFDVLDEVQRTSEDHYPPYNIERTGENRFQISVALAGFTPEEIALTVEQNVRDARRPQDREGRNATSCYRGISAAGVQAPVHASPTHVQVKGACFENGLLSDRPGPRDSRKP